MSGRCLMRFYGIRKGRIINKLSLRGFMLKERLGYILELDKEEKERKRDSYQYSFTEKYGIEKSNQIPDGFFYEPGVIIATDLVAKENIVQVKKGLKRMILKYTTKKFFGGFSDITRIKNYIDNLNENITDNESWIKLGRFDFSDFPALDKNIAYFDIKLMNLSSSFIAIQFIIYMSDERKQELVKLINEDYKGNLKQVVSYYQRRKNKSGARKRYTVSTISKDYVKKMRISEFITEIKWILFNQISKDTPLLFHNLGVIPPSVNVFKTNITFDRNERLSFLYSVGYDSSVSLPISDDSTLIVDSTFGNLNDKDFLDYMYIVNTELSEQKDYYADMDHQIAYELEELYSYLMKTHILKVMSNNFSSMTSSYRNKIKNIKIKKRSYKKLLMLRYAYEKDIDFFKRLFEEIDWEYEKEKLSSLPIKNKESLDGPQLHTYQLITESPFFMKERIEKYQNYIRYELENKLTLTSHLKDYKIEGRNNRLNILNIFISTITFLSLLFPRIPIVLAKQLKEIFSSFFQLLTLYIQ